jgi:hypothetical protein
VCEAMFAQLYDARFVEGNRMVPRAQWADFVADYEPLLEREREAPQADRP